MNIMGKKVTFNPTISFDGVAIIVSCIGCAIWCGGLSEKVSYHTDQLKRHEVIIQTISDAQKLQTQNIAILQTLVSERTHNGTKSP